MLYQEMSLANPITFKFLKLLKTLLSFERVWLRLIQSKQRIQLLGCLRNSVAISKNSAW